jgi:hypothetical protein
MPSGKNQIRKSVKLGWDFQAIDVADPASGATQLSQLDH